MKWEGSDKGETDRAVQEKHFPSLRLSLESRSLLSVIKNRVQHLQDMQIAKCNTLPLFDVSYDYKSNSDALHSGHTVTYTLCQYFLQIL